VKTFNFITQNSGKVAEMQAKAHEFGLKIVQVNAPYQSSKLIRSRKLSYTDSATAKRSFRPIYYRRFRSVHRRRARISRAVLFVRAKNDSNNGVVKLIGEGRPARFESAIGSYFRDFKLFHGRVEGRIVSSRGHRGFGFDPIFEYEGRTFAEMTVDEKNALSHRSKAAELFLEWASTII